MSDEMKMSEVPRGATHWQPRTEFNRECFYKKIPSGVSMYVVAPSDDRCNKWDSSACNGELDVISVYPVSFISNHDRLTSDLRATQELLQLKELECQQLADDKAELVKALCCITDNLTEEEVESDNGYQIITVSALCVDVDAISDAEELLERLK